MFTDHLFIALSKTLFESCIQALLVWLCIKAMLAAFPAIPAAIRYRAHFSGLCLVFAGFVATLLYHIDLLAFPSATSELIYASAGHPVPLQSFQRVYTADPGFLTGNYSRRIASFYFAGLAISGLRLFFGYIKLNRVVSYKTRHTDAKWSDRLQILAERLGITRTVKLYFREKGEIPFTLGHLKPLIYFPLASINYLTTDQVEAILLHELAHIKRCDYLFNLAQQSMLTFLFFNPFAWILDRQISREREYCCDDLVIAHRVNPGEYAAALLHLEENRKHTSVFALAATGPSKYPLLNRIKRIIMKSPETTPLQRLSLLAFTAAVFISIACAVPDAGLKNFVREKVRTMDLPVLGRALTKKIPALPPLKSHAPMLNPSLKTLLSLPADTVKKQKFKIVTEDDKGNKTEYSSIEEMPAAVKEDFLSNNNNGLAAGMAAREEVAKMMRSPEWKKQMEEIRNMQNSPEWKKQMEEIRNMQNSPEWKKQMEEIRNMQNSPEWKKQMEEIRNMQSSPEWKKQMEEIRNMTNNPEWKKYTEQLAKSSAEIAKYYNSAEWKKYAEDLAKNSAGLARGFSSTDWNKQKEDLGEKPLVVVDGKIYPITAGFNYSSASNEEYAKMLNLKPEDIKEINILKGKDATKLWGDAAKNGVLDITTKSAGNKKN